MAASPGGNAGPGENTRTPAQRAGAMPARATEWWMDDNLASMTIKQGYGEETWKIG